MAKQDDEDVLVEGGDNIVDFSEVQGLRPIPEGWYHCEVTKTKLGTSKAGNSKLDVQFKVLDGAYKGRMFFETLTFGAAAWRAKQILMGCGFDAKYRGTIEEIADDLVGRTCDARASVEVSTQIDPESGEPYEPRNRVKQTREHQSTVDDLVGA